MMCRYTSGYMVIWLLIDSENGHLRLKARGVVQSSDLDDKRVWSRRTAGPDGSTACGTEKACYRPLQIATLKGRR